MPFPKAKATIPGLRPHTRYTRMSDVNARSRRAPTTRNKARANTGACDRRQEQALSQGLHRASPSPRPYPTDRPWPLDPRGRQSTDTVLSRPRRRAFFSCCGPRLLPPCVSFYCGSFVPRRPPRRRRSAHSISHAPAPFAAPFSGPPRDTYRLIQTRAALIPNITYMREHCRNYFWVCKPVREHNTQR